MKHYEIEACVIRAKNGNRVELLKLLEQYKPYIFKTAKGFNIKNYDMYDLLQIGYVTLINAVAKYRTGSNTFSTYAFNAIKNNFKDIARKNSKYAGELSLNSPLNEEGDSSTEFIDSLAAEDNVEEDIISSELLLEMKGAVAKLPADEVELVLMVYYSGLSIKTYAQKTGLTYLQAIRKRDRILEKLRRLTGNKGI